MKAPEQPTSDDIGDRMLGWYRLVEQIGIREWPGAPWLVPLLAERVSRIGAEAAVQDAYVAGCAVGILLERDARTKGRKPAKRDRAGR